MISVTIDYLGEDDWSCFKVHNITSYSRYALVNILLIIGAKKDIKILVVLWLLESIHVFLLYEPRTNRRITGIACISCRPLQFTLGFLIWSFVLVSIMLTYDTSPGFVAFIALAQLLNFAVLGRYQRNQVIV